jgi:hypothetical protein
MSSSIEINKPIDTNIPVITPAGGTSIAYEDPNSPESIMKKTAEANVQAIIDQQYDTQVNPYESKKKKEGFKSNNFNFSSLKLSNFDFLFNIAIIIFLVILYFIPSLKKVNLIFIVIGIIGISLLLLNYFIDTFGQETYRKYRDLKGILILIAAVSIFGLMIKGSKK